MSNISDPPSFPVDDREETLMKALRNCVESDPDLVSPTDNNYLLKFLRYAKHDVDRAMEAIRKFWRLAENHSSLFEGAYEKCLLHLPSKHFTIFKSRDAHNRQILLHRMRNWDPSIPMLDMTSYELFILDLFTSRQLTQLHGVTVIIDLKGMTMGHAKAGGLFEMKTFLQLVHTVPLKVKGLHFVNTPSVFAAMWAIMKLFLKEKMKKRVVFHGSDWASFHEFFSPEILPKCFGGLLAEDEWEEENMLEKIVERKEYSVDSMDVKKYGFHGKKGESK